MSLVLILTLDRVFLTTSWSRFVIPSTPPPLTSMQFRLHHCLQPSLLSSISIIDFPIIAHLAPDSCLHPSPRHIIKFPQQSMASSRGSTFSPPSSSPGYDTSLPHVLSLCVDTPPQIMSPTPLSLTPCLSITSELTWLA